MRAQSGNDMHLASSSQEGSESDDSCLVWSINPKDETSAFFTIGDDESVSSSPSRDERRVRFNLCGIEAHESTVKPKELGLTWYSNKDYDRFNKNIFKAIAKLLSSESSFDARHRIFRNGFQLIFDSLIEGSSLTRFDRLMNRESMKMVYEQTEDLVGLERYAFRFLELNAGRERCAMLAILAESLALNNADSISTKCRDVTRASRVFSGECAAAFSDSLRK